MSTDEGATVDPGERSVGEGTGVCPPWPGFGCGCAGVAEDGERASEGVEDPALRPMSACGGDSDPPVPIIVPASLAEVDTLPPEAVGGTSEASPGCVLLPLGGGGKRDMEQ